jgi:hypothetical protein
MQTELKICEIELQLKPYVYDSFKRINHIMPKVLENGSKSMHLEAFLLMSKILIKMGSLNLDPQNGGNSSSGI